MYLQQRLSAECFQSFFRYVLIIAVVPGVITSYYVESTKLRADESSAKFLDDLERLPELSKEELVELSEKVKKFNRKK